ncbi:uncharacterized protein LOC135399694 [Ornithodoros turicata]|uniref:uncharacterized protein LOC135399694 n=1 Tax=Ornithodoros turicata TaxID=34597 RepID=UPI003138E99E
MSSLTEAGSQFPQDGVCDMVYLDTDIVDATKNRGLLERLYKESRGKPNTLYGLFFASDTVRYEDSAGIIGNDTVKALLRTGWESWVRHYGANLIMIAKYTQAETGRAKSWLQGMNDITKDFNNAVPEYSVYPSYLVVMVNPYFKSGVDDVQEWNEVIQTLLNTGLVDGLVLSPATHIAVQSGGKHLVTSVAPWSTEPTIRCPNYEGVLTLLASLNMPPVKPYTFLTFVARASQFSSATNIPFTADTRDGAKSKWRFDYTRSVACYYYQSAGTSSRVDNETVSTYFQRLNDTALYTIDTPQNFASKACLAAQRHQFQGGYSVFNAEYAAAERCNPIKLENGTVIKGKYANVHYIRTLRTRTFGGADCAQVPV